MNSDPFEALGLPVSFDISRSAIESAYLTRIAGAHPDHRDSGDDAGPDAATLNDARRSLLRDETRANLVLASEGGPGPDEDDSLPEGFLFEIMDVRMEIEAALASGGDAERAEWNAWAEAQRKEYREQIATLFGRVRADREATLREIRRVLNAWRYIERLIEQLDPDYDPARADFA